MLLRKVQYCVTKEATDFALGRNEVGGSCGVEDVLVGGVLAFRRVAIQQRIRRLALQDCCKLPCQVFGILHAGVRAAGSEGRHTMRSVAREEDAPMPEL